jgi:GNAT superfamily N-acetyltransferase
MTAPLITIRRLDPVDVRRIGEIDRSERITTGYVYRDGRLESESVDWDVQPWLADDDSHFWSVAHHVRQFAAALEKGGILLGAFDGEVLAGFAILRYRLAPGMAQLAALFVSRPYRRSGVGRLLVAEVECLAREDGARSLYVSAVPSESAVGFYLDWGFRPAAEPNPELLALEPDDIHMVKPL